jgi:hypothetical protein
MIANEILVKYPKIYDGEFCTIYDMRQEIPNTSLAFWKGFFRIESPSFQKDMKYSLNFIREKNIKAMISDHSLLKVVTPDVLAWLHANWYAVAAKNGLKIEASLEPQDIFAKATLGKMLEANKISNIHALKFGTFEDAYTYSAELAKKMWVLSALQQKI